MNDTTPTADSPSCGHGQKTRSQDDVCEIMESSARFEQPFGGGDPYRLRQENDSSLCTIQGRAMMLATMWLCVSRA